jgi:hypothetical protein
MKNTFLTAEEKLRRLDLALKWGGHPTHTLNDLIETIKAGEAQLWEQGDGCIVTQIHKFPLFTAVNYWTISGSLSDCLALEDRINSWAIAEEGCSMATAAGRRGWGRVAAPTGWKAGIPHFFKPLVPEGAK